MESKSLFDIKSRGSRASEKRILLDICEARQAYKAQEISKIGLGKSSHSLADGLAKSKAQAALHQLLKIAYLKPKVEK